MIFFLFIFIYFIYNVLLIYHKFMSKRKLINLYETNEKMQRDIRDYRKCMNTGICRCCYKMKPIVIDCTKCVMYNCKSHICVGCIGIDLKFLEDEISSIWNPIPQQYSKLYNKFKCIRGVVCTVECFIRCDEEITHMISNKNEGKFIIMKLNYGFSGIEYFDEHDVYTIWGICWKIRFLEKRLPKVLVREISSFL